MPRRRTLVQFAMLAVALLAGGCGDETADDPPDSTTTSMTDASLEDTLWLLVSVGASQTPVVAGTSPTLHFLPDNRYTADTGCNTVNGAYTTSGEDGLRLGIGQSTLRACPDPAAQLQELALTRAFDEVRTVRLDGDDGDGSRLSLLDESGSLLATYAGASTDLAGTEWQVTGVNTGSAVESTALTERLSLEFGTADQVTGHAGCNSFTGTYTVDGDRLTFGDLAATEMACEPDVMALEQAYLAALAQVTGVRRTGTSLALVDASGAAQVSLVPPSP